MQNQVAKIVVPDQLGPHWKKVMLHVFIWEILANMTQVSDVPLDLLFVALFWYKEIEFAIIFILTMLSCIKMYYFWCLQRILISCQKYNPEYPHQSSNSPYPMCITSLANTCCSLAKLMDFPPQCKLKWTKWACFYQLYNLILLLIQSKYHR
jgi:hypothetical protein